MRYRPLLLSIFIIRQDLLLSLELINWLSRKSQGLPVSTILYWGHRLVLPYLAFYMGGRDPKSGSQTYKAKTTH